MMTTSPVLLRDYQLEAEFLAANPDCDNVRIAHCRRHLGQCGMFYDRSGTICYIYNTYRKQPIWKRQKIQLYQGPAMAAISAHAYGRMSCKEGDKIIHTYLHHEIADIFLPNTDLTKTQIDHINGDHLDNRAENLERVTPEENNRRKWYNYYLQRGLTIPERYQTP